MTHTLATRSTPSCSLPTSRSSPSLPCFVPSLLLLYLLQFPCSGSSTGSSTASCGSAPRVLSLLEVFSAIAKPSAIKPNPAWDWANHPQSSFCLLPRLLPIAYSPSTVFQVCLEPLLRITCKLRVHYPFGHFKSAACRAHSAIKGLIRIWCLESSQVLCSASFVL